jgi:putative phosphoribosyl transferase
VPVAAEVARAVGGELDAIVVRKIGAPGQEELAIGAVAAGGGLVINEAIVASLGLAPAVIAALVAGERRELERRERVLRGDRPFPDVRGREVILVDDGIATGATMRAAVEAVAARRPVRLVVAAPVGPLDANGGFGPGVDAVVVPERPVWFGAVGEGYCDFRPVEDAEVRALLGAGALAPGE